MANKWNKQYWQDLGERVASTEIGALLTTAVLAGATPINWSDGKAVWATLGVPPAVSLAKGLLVNLGGGSSPSASFAGVSSTKMRG